MWKSITILSFFLALVWVQASLNTSADEPKPIATDGPTPIATASPLVATPVPVSQCQTFDICMRWTLNATDPMQKALYARQGIPLWNKTLPQRDLINLIQIRADTLVELFQSNQNDNLLAQAEADYLQLKTLLTKSYVPFVGLGRVAELRGQHIEASRFFADAVKTDNLIAWLSRAAYRLRQGQINPAKADLESADKRIRQMQKDEKEIHVSHHIWFHKMRAEVFQALKQDKQAQAELQAACHLGHEPACQSPS